MNCQNVKTAIDTTSRREPLHETVKTHLGGCADCRSYADDTSALLALLSAQPRVEAPADFNFKLRARIARAQADPRGPVAVLESFWAKTFSWSQAAAATAMLALVAALSAYYFIGNRQATPNDQFMAKVNPATQPAAVQPVASAYPATEKSAPADLAPIKAQMMKAMTKSARTSAPTLIPAVAGAPSKQIRVALSDDTTRFYSREKRQVITASSKGYVYGAEDAGLSKPAVFVASF